MFFIICSVPLLAWPVVNGVAICTALNDQDNPVIVSDGAGGAIITWDDYRSTTGDTSLGSDIYAQWVNSSGIAKAIPSDSRVAKRAARLFYL